MKSKYSSFSFLFILAVATLANGMETEMTRISVKMCTEGDHHIFVHLQELRSFGAMQRENVLERWDERRIIPARKARLPDDMCDVISFNVSISFNKITEIYQRNKVEGSIITGNCADDAKAFFLGVIKELNRTSPFQIDLCLPKSRTAPVFGNMVLRLPHNRLLTIPCTVFEEISETVQRHPHVFQENEQVVRRGWVSITDAVFFGVIAGAGCLIGCIEFVAQAL